MPEGLKDWKTTVPFVIGGIAVFISLAPQYGVHIPAWVQLLSATFAALGISAGGVNAISKSATKPPQG